MRSNGAPLVPACPTRQPDLGAGSPTLTATLPRLGEVQSDNLLSAPPSQSVFYAWATGIPIPAPCAAYIVTEDPALRRTRARANALDLVALRAVLGAGGDRVSG